MSSSSVQKPCPRCGSSDIEYVEARCKCNCHPSCWCFPVCKRCRYTNGQHAANSDGTYWGDEGTFTNVPPLSTELTPEIQKIIDERGRPPARIFASEDGTWSVSDSSNTPYILEELHTQICTKVSKRQLIERINTALEDILTSLDLGEIYIEDFDPDLIERLRALINKT